MINNNKKMEGSDMEELKIELSENDYDFLTSWLRYQTEETTGLPSPQPIMELDYEILNFIALVHRESLPDGYHWQWEGKKFIFAEKTF